MRANFSASGTQSEMPKEFRDLRTPAANRLRLEPHTACTALAHACVVLPESGARYAPESGARVNGVDSENCAR